MNGKFSKWNKRITAWVLIIAGLYMFLFGDYDFVSKITVLGSGLMAVGIAVFHSIKSRVGGNPPPEDEQDTPG